MSSVALKSWKKGTEQTEVLENGKGSDLENGRDNNSIENISKCVGSQKRKIRNKGRQSTQPPLIKGERWIQVPSKCPIPPVYKHGLYLGFEGGKRKGIKPHATLY